MAAKEELKYTIIQLRICDTFQVPKIQLSHFSKPKGHVSHA